MIKITTFYHLEVKYTKYMRLLAQTSLPVKPKNQSIQIASLALAGILIVMVVSQLFAFEDFVPLIYHFGLFGGQPEAKILASFLVTAEVFALPFLLRMYVNPLMRVVSMVLGWFVAGLWFYMTIVATGGGKMLNDSGFLGTAVTVPVGWWSVVFAMGLVALTAWVSWGLWPLRNKHQR